MPPGNGAGSSGTQTSSTTNSKKRRRPSNSSISPRVTAKNRYSPLSNANDNTDIDLATSSEGEDNQQDEVSQKIPPIYVYNITDFENFHKSLSTKITDEFTINHTKNALKLNVSSIDDYRSITKKFDDSEIQYHTYQFPLDKQLSIIIRNLPVSITEESIFKALSDLDFKVTSVTRLQNRFKCPIPIVAILLSNASKKIYALNRLLHCVVSVEPRKPTKEIPQCTNCQRFSHTKKFCHLPPRCVKCAGDHHFSQCVKEKETPPKCVNCANNHPSNYRGCSYYKELLKSKKMFSLKTRANNQATSQQTRQFTNINYTAPNERLINVNTNSERKTYAKATKSNNIADNDFMQTLLPLINNFVTQLMQKIIESLPFIINSLNTNTNVKP